MPVLEAEFKEDTYLRILSWMGSVFEMKSSTDAEPCWDLSVEEIHLNGKQGVL